MERLKSWINDCAKKTDIWLAIMVSAFLMLPKTAFIVLFVIMTGHWFWSGLTRRDKFATLLSIGLALIVISIYGYVWSSVQGIWGRTFEKVATVMVECPGDEEFREFTFRAHESGDPEIGVTLLSCKMAIEDVSPGYKLVFDNDYHNDSQRTQVYPIREPEHPRWELFQYPWRPIWLPPN